MRVWAGAKHLERVVKAKPDDYEAWLELAAVYERLNKNKAVHAYTEALRVYLGMWHCRKHLQRSICVSCYNATELVCLCLHN